MLHPAVSIIKTQSQGRLAQLVERFVYTEDVGSSSLSSPTNLRPSGYGKQRQTVGSQAMPTLEQLTFPSSYVEHSSQLWVINPQFFCVLFSVSFFEFAESAKAS